MQPRTEHESTQTVDRTHGIHNLSEINSMHIRQILRLANGRVNGPGGAAELLGIHPNTLRKRMDKLGIPYKRIK
jgi:transcriptional regulator with GAF, ATPase, and Fis domain